jgi:hypothetical protein
METARQQAVIKAVTRHERAKRLTASSFPLGSIIAWVYSKVTPAAIIVETELNEPKTPKSAGEKRRLIIGVRAKPIAWAAAVPDITTRTFLTKEDFPSLANICSK